MHEVLKHVKLRYTPIFRNGFRQNPRIWQIFIAVDEMKNLSHAHIVFPNPCKAFENSFDIWTIGILYILVIGCHGMGLPPGGGYGWGGPSPQAPFSA